MFPYFTIFGKDIPMYGVMALIGAVLLVLLSQFLAKKRGKVKGEDIFYMLLYAAIGVLIGAKLLYLLVSVDVYWLPDKDFAENMKYWLAVLTSGGFVFYGGLIGGVIGGLRYAIHYKLPLSDAVEAIVPGIPLFHAFGRVGCFMSGCCYGIEYDGPLAVTFTNSLGAPNGVSLLPVQLIEAVFNLVLCAVLVVLFLKKARTWLISGTYLVAYGIARFILEFFRGDIVRGKALGLTTSQWISFAIVAFGVALICNLPTIIMSKRKPKEA